MNMENISGAGGRGIAGQRSPRDLIFEEIVPSSGWTEDADCRCLIIDLPGFKTDEVKLQVDNNGHLIVSGKRQVDEMKHISFQQFYKIPDNSNIADATAKFEDDILYIFIPKIATTDHKDDREEKTAEADHVQEDQYQYNNALDKDEVLDEAPVDSHQKTEGGMPEEEREEQEDELHDAKITNPWNEGSLVEAFRVQLYKNKGIFVTAVLAFSLGVLVSQKFKFQTDQVK